MDLPETTGTGAAGLVRQGELEFRRLLDTLPVGAYTCDRDGLITYCNPAVVALWGRMPALGDPRDRYSGALRLYAIDGTPIPHAQCRMALALHDRREYARHEILIEQPDGRRLTVLEHATPQIDASGHLVGAVNVLVDISDSKRAEEVQAQLAAIVASSDDAIVTKSLDGRILFWNAGAERLYGYSADETLGRPISLIIPAERQAEEKAILERLLRGERVEHYETVRIAKNGTRIDVSLTSSPVHDGTGRVVAISKVARDVSDRKRAELAQSQLAAIVESSDDAIVSKSLDGEITFWNAGAERLYGYSSSEAIGRPVSLIIPPEQHAEEAVILERLLRGERVEHYETVRVAKDGTRIDVSLTSSPVRDGSGRIVGISKVARDIGARKRQEAALVAVRDELAQQVADLRRLHELSTELSTTLDLDRIVRETLRTAAAIESTGVGVLALCDEHGRLEPAARLGFDAGPCASLLETGFHGSPVDACFRDGKRVVVAELDGDARFAAFAARAGACGIVGVHCTPLISRAGRTVGVLATFFDRPHRPAERDVRLIDLCARQALDFIESARLYTQVLEADRAKNAFLATLAHELRNPLAPVRNAVAILRAKAGHQRELAWAVDVVDRQTRQMKRLIDDLLDIARISGDKLKLELEWIDLRGVIDTAAEVAAPLIESKRHTLTIDGPAEPLTLRGDPTRLAQALSNLLNNAAKYTEPGGRIHVAVRQAAEHVDISVRDTGIGIPPGMLHRVFEMFAQVDQAIDRSEGGLGIGLALVQKLVEMHGGSVAAESEGPGKGSVFTIRLPVAAQTAGDGGRTEASAA